MKNNKNGFTLIELLVVVLIIGILSSVALPQYQKAVKKSRGVEITLAAETLVKAMNLAYLSDGVYNKTFYTYSGGQTINEGQDNFDIEVPYIKPKLGGNFWLSTSSSGGSTATVQAVLEGKFNVTYSLSAGKLSSVTCTGTECKTYFPQYM